MSKKLIKLPVAKVGSFFDEAHGVISFKPSDLDALERNFRKKMRGYEPYARYGHSEKGAGIWDGERAQGHMVEAVREGDILFGLFEPTNDDVVGEVDRQEYRYASPEIIRGARSRETNEPVGLVLKGVALTNSPNIPNLPRNTIVEVDSLEWLLSDDADVIRPAVIEIPVGAIMSASTEVITETAVETSTEATPAVATEAAVVPAFTKALELFTNALSAFKPATPAVVAADPATAEETPDVMNAEDQKKLADLEAAKLALETENARLAKEAQDLADAKAALEAEKAEAARKAEEAREAEEARKAEELEAKAALMLSDRCELLVKEGVPPADVAKAKILISALRKSVQTVMLSDGADPLNLEDAVLDLLSDRKGTVKFGKVGVDVNPTGEKPVNRLLEQPKAS